MNAIFQFIICIKKNIKVVISILILGFLISIYSFNNIKVGYQSVAHYKMASVNEMYTFHLIPKVLFPIKGTNILFDMEKETPILIDFGLSVQISNINFDDNLITLMKNLKNIFYVYAPEYSIWSLEIHYLSYILHKNKEPTVVELTDIAEKYVMENKALNKNFSPWFLKKYKEKCIRQLKKYNEIDYMKRIKHLFNYWETFDNYALSIMYLRFLKYININGFLDNYFIKFFSKLLLKNIDPNPDNRLSIVETIHTFNTFLYQKNNETNIQTFEELTDSFIESRDIIEEKVSRDKKKGLYDTKSMKIVKRKALKTHI